jgi:hypothetical protein
MQQFTDSWSVFMRPTRTNNDVEGWHHRLNKDKKAGSGNKGLYTIAPLLIEEANPLPIQIQLVSEGKLKKLQRRHVRTTQRPPLDVVVCTGRAHKNRSRVNWPNGAGDPGLFNVLGEVH